jgi:hypothetical protein
MLNIDSLHQRVRLRSASSMTGNATAPIFLKAPPGLPSTVILTRAFRNIGGFDPNLVSGEDYHLLLRLSLLGPWQYVTGAPLTRRLNVNAVFGGEPSLSEKFADHALTWTQMLDRFIHEEGGAAAIPEPLWRRKLGHLWFRAGRKLVALDRRAEAAQCFQRALEINPRHWRARWRILTTREKSI